MLMRPSVFVFAILGLVLCIATAMAYDPDNYCGIPAYPQAVRDLPTLPKHEGIVSPRLIYHHTFVRHGDRSTIVANCFPGLPELKKRVWEQCPDTTSAGHNGMSARELEPHRFDLNAKPLEGSQILDGNCHSGQLSQHGSRMSYNNGLRVGRYLSAAFHRSGAAFGPDSLTLRSTDYHRTRETATSFITGLLDSMPHSADLMDKVVPIGWIDAATDGLKINSHLCNAAEYLDEVYKSKEWVEYLEKEWRPLQQLVGSIVNEEEPDLHDVFDCAKTYLCHHQDLPDGYLELADSRVEQFNTKYWAYAFEYDHARSSKAFSGVFIIDLLNAFTQIAVQGRDMVPRFSLYSGHDFGPMMNIISLFQIDKLIWPPYSAMLNVEMYHVKNDEQSYMRFIYNESVYIPRFCGDHAVGELCPTRVVLEFLTNLIPTGEECPKLPRGFAVAQLEEAITNAKQAAANGTYSGVKIEVAEAALAGIKLYNSQLKAVHQRSLEASRDVQRTHIERWTLE